MFAGAGVWLIGVGYYRVVIAELNADRLKMSLIPVTVVVGPPISKEGRILVV